GGATGGGSFLSSLMQGGMSVLGGISAMREGDEKAAALREQGLQAQDDARQERLAGMQRTDQLRRQLLDEQGQRDVAYAASGIDLSFGTPVVARAQADDDAARALAISGETTNARAAQYEQRAASYRAAAGRAKSTGLLNALGIGAKTMMSAANRG
ncbi:MAG: hypothetical protein LCH61_16420, partial [Proteobacteria bacterium]|nr:hypothetical protein [Pseudomonadota bacterium]